MQLLTRVVAAFCLLIHWCTPFICMNPKTGCYAASAFTEPLFYYPVKHDDPSVSCSLFNEVERDNCKLLEYNLSKIYKCTGFGQFVKYNWASVADSLMWALSISNEGFWVERQTRTSHTNVMCILIDEEWIDIFRSFRG